MNISPSIAIFSMRNVTKRRNTGAIRKSIVAVFVSFTALVITSASVTLSFQQDHLFDGANGRRNTKCKYSSAIAAARLATNKRSLNQHKKSNRVPYSEADYDPRAAEEFYEARPMKSIGRFLQIASKSSRFVFDTIFLDDKTGDRTSSSSRNNNRFEDSDARITMGLTNLERERSKELVDLITALGPTFIKVGQALSTRTDLLPTDKAYYAIGLSELQDAVEPSFDSEEALGIIRDELGIQDIDEVFEYLSEEPVASASIGQVYRGKLRKNGLEVAVKVQRPNVLENVALDLYVMRSILVPLWNKLQNSRNRKNKNNQSQSNISGNNEDDGNIVKSNTDSIALVDAWGQGFVNELDYRAEANATREFTKAMKDRGLGSVVFAPEVIDELSSTHVLTTKWVDGERLSDSDEDDVPRLCGVALNAYLTMLLDTGTLHCDPHPGNLLRTPDGKLCILDWGMVLEVPTDLQLSLLEFIADLNAENYEKVPDDLVKLKFVPEDKIDDLRKSGLTVGIAKMLSLAAEGGGPKGAMKRMVAQNKVKYAEALKDFDDLDSEEATKVRQKLFQEDWRKAMAEDSMSREQAIGTNAGTSTTVDLTSKIESMRQQNTDVFAIPEYFVYMSRAFATLEGIGLSSDENYSILQECYPYLAKRLLSDDSPRAREALRTLLYGKNGKELDLTKLQELSDGLESYTTSVSSVESGRNADNSEGRDAALQQVASILLSEDSNYVQEVVLRETAVALDATFRDTISNPLEPIIRNISTPTALNGGTFTNTPLNIFRPFTFPIVLAKASLELNSIDEIDERRLENIRILTKIASGASGRTSPNSNEIRENNSNGGVTDVIGKVTQEVAKRRVALARIGVRLGGTIASVQAERLRERALAVNGQSERDVSMLVELLASNGASRLEELSEALHLFDDELSKQKK